MTTPTTKRCTQCGNTKPLDEFYRKGGFTKDGSPRTQSACKLCSHVIRNRARNRSAHKPPKEETWWNHWNHKI